LTTDDFQDIIENMFEVELKSLVSDIDEIINLKKIINILYPKSVLKSSHKQLNSYFLNTGNLQELLKSLKGYISTDKFTELSELVASNPANYSMRTRETDGRQTLFIIKIGSDNGDSSNGVSRREFECKVNMPYDQLDLEIINLGFEYLSRWSRERNEYELEKNLNLCIDKNAGYGYVIEIEKMTDSEDKINQIEQELRTVLQNLGLKELNTDRLNRMFDFYNQNWQEYFGTEKVFNLE
jgi:predicted adenylyl cyclase CyaB